MAEFSWERTFDQRPAERVRGGRLASGGSRGRTRLTGPAEWWLRSAPERVDCDRHLLVDLRADERRRRLDRVHELAQRLDIVAQEARDLAEAARVVDAAGAVEVANRDVDVQPAPRS